MCVCHMICVSSRLLASVFDCIYLHRCCCTCATQAIITVISIIICMFQKTLLLKWNHRVTNVTHCLVAKSTGSVLCKIEHFCLTLQMTCSTWIRTFAIVIVSSFPNWSDNCRQLHTTDPFLLRMWGCRASASFLQGLWCQINGLPTLHLQESNYPIFHTVL